MKKQTAVEWLFEQFENGDMYNIEDAQRIKHQALAMEKEQIVTAHIEGQPLYSCHSEKAKQYYNETYNND